MLKIEAFDLSDKGDATPYFRRQMSILNKVSAKPGIQVDRILGEFSKDEIEIPYPALGKVMVEALAEELALIGYLVIADGKATVTESRPGKIGRFQEGIAARGTCSAEHVTCVFFSLSFRSEEPAPAAPPGGAERFVRTRSAVGAPGPFLAPSCPLQPDRWNKGAATSCESVCGEKPVEGFHAAAGQIPRYARNDRTREASGARSTGRKAKGHQLSSR